MAALINLKKRKSTVASIKQLTSAMSFISSIKLRKFQRKLLKIRPYAYEMGSLLEALKKDTSCIEHPLVKKREIKKIKIVVVSSDKGLCGSYNILISKKLEEKLGDIKEKEVSVDFIGEKAFKEFYKRNKGISKLYKLDQDNYEEEISKISENIIKDYIDLRFDSLFVLYNEYKSPIHQKIKLEKLFPLCIDKKVEFKVNSYSNNIYEPDKKTLFDKILPNYIKVEFLRIMLESFCSEHGARMTAMEKAKNNSEDVIDNLNLFINRQRQNIITKELNEIIVGKEALEGD